MEKKRVSDNKRLDCVLTMFSADRIPVPSLPHHLIWTCILSSISSCGVGICYVRVAKVVVCNYYYYYTVGVAAAELRIE